MFVVIHLGVTVDIPCKYLEKIRAVYPNISFEHLDFNQDGMVNDIVVVNHQIVGRFAKDDRGKKDLAHEAKVLKVIQNYIDLQVPQFEHLEEGFVSYRFIFASARPSLLVRDVNERDKLSDSGLQF